MARLVVLAAVLAFVAVASAQPCIECKDCRTDNCYRNCRPSCPQYRPSDVAANGDACKNRGNMFGPNAARSACDTAQKYCNGGRPPGTGRMGAGIGTVNLAQCANIAMGACQGTANNGGNWGHPCGNSLRNGFAQCNAQQFKTFFEGETRDLCLNFAKSITGVEPGTNQWAQPSQPQYRPPQQQQQGGNAGGPFGFGILPAAIGAIVANGRH